VIVDAGATPECITIRINGESRATSPETTIAQLLSELGLPADRVAVELDKRIVRKTEWASTPLADGSQIEIVQFVGGG
jgi:sulfur carrier protein